VTEIDHNALARACNATVKHLGGATAPVLRIIRQFTDGMITGIDVLMRPAFGALEQAQVLPGETKEESDARIKAELAPIRARLAKQVGDDKKPTKRRATSKPSADQLTLQLLGK
jgi:hypothetical protein